MTEATLAATIRAAIDRYLLAERGAVPVYDDDTSLLAIGVDSIAALSIGMEIEERLGVMVSDDLIFNHPTVAALSRVLARR
ncbi:acyl carrier protein [Nevskia sp.]|uniref:acyl carrier protein n=1 Tax=Nevskia sp. TaxID=1929292 RepID=UPI0025D38764|nr:acyl carrier protein [Nevskia sp.]